MDRRMRRSNLIDKAMLQFTICVTILMLLATPLFYWLTKHYYAEDLILVIDTIKHGKDIPPLDVERDIMHGIMIPIRTDNMHHRNICNINNEKYFCKALDTFLLYTKPNKQI